LHTGAYDINDIHLTLYVFMSFLQMKDTGRETYKMSSTLALTVHTSLNGSINIGYQEE